MTDASVATVEMHDVLTFWFDGPNQDVAAAQRQMPRCFRTDPALDQQIMTHFGATLAAARAGELEDWARTPDGWLALLIVLGQFSRNIHRGLGHSSTPAEAEYLTQPGAGFLYASAWFALS